MEDSRASTTVPVCSTGVASSSDSVRCTLLTSAVSYDRSHDLSHDWSCDKPPEPLPETTPYLLPNVSNVCGESLSVVQYAIVDVDLCGRCGTLLTERIYKRSIRMKCKDGLYRQRQRTMKRIRCLECLWVKPTILGNAAPIPQTIVRGCGIAQILNAGQDGASVCGISVCGISACGISGECGKGDKQSSNDTPGSDCV